MINYCFFLCPRTIKAFQLCLLAERSPWWWRQYVLLLVIREVVDSYLSPETSCPDRIFVVLHVPQRICLKLGSNSFLLQPFKFHFSVTKTRQLLSVKYWLLKQRFKGNYQYILWANCQVLNVKAGHTHHLPLRVMSQSASRFKFVSPVLVCTSPGWCSG